MDFSLNARRFDIDGEAKRLQSYIAGAESSRPVVSRAARFHDDALDLAVIEEARELGAGETVLFDHAMLTIGERELEDVFCQIDGDGCSMHVGLLSFVMLTPHP